MRNAFSLAKTIARIGRINGFATTRRHRLVAAVLALIVLAWLPGSAADAANNAFVGSANRPQNDGYWLVTDYGAVKAWGHAPHLGDMNGKSLNRPIVGMASTPSGLGYWLVATDGGIFSFGDAQFYGSTGSIRLNKPIVGMASTPSGLGYWMVASDGGIFAYGDAAFFGSTGGIRLSQPIVGMSTTPNGHGYWLAGADGGIFAYGDARFYGAALKKGDTGAIAIVATADGGYSIVRRDGSYDYRPAPQPVVTPPVEAPIPPTTTTTTVPSSGGSTPTTAPPTTTTTTTPPSTSNWELLFQDNFNGTSIDSTRWSVYNGTGNEGVGFRRPSNVRVTGGELQLVGSGDIGAGICYCKNNGTPTYGAQTYGRWEVRARIDKGTGYGPAALLWPKSGVWPEDGEIDISEIPKGDRLKSHFTLHYGSNNSQQGKSSTGDFSQWHTFGVEWQADHITYFLDGVPVYTNVNPAAIPDKAMHLALQLDVGADGHWIPGRTAETPAEVIYHVDWVKIYR